MENHCFWALGPLGVLGGRGGSMGPLETLRFRPARRANRWKFSRRPLPEADWGPLKDPTSIYKGPRAPGPKKKTKKKL